MAIKNTSGAAGAQGGTQEGGNTAPNLGDENADTGKTGAGAGAGASAEGVQNLGDEGAAAAADKGAGAATAEIDFKLPEGVDEKDPFFEGFKDFAKAEGISAAQAQKLADRYGAQVKAAKEQVAAQRQKQVDGWFQSLKADKEIGGTNFDQAFSVAKQGLEQFATPEFKQLLRESGLGSHPEMVRFIYRTGKALAEDSSAGAGGNGGKENTRAAQLRARYPEMFKNKE